MKKFVKKCIACLIILLVFAGAVFYFGWTQFKVGQGECGVLVSKTSGVNPTPVIPGKFSWHWEFLLPTNAELKLFPLAPHSVIKVVSGSLPSADVYATVYDTPPDFSYRFDFSISARVSPERVVSLVREGTIDDAESLATYLDSFCTAAANRAATFILAKSAEADFTSATVSESELREIANSVGEQYSAVEFTIALLFAQLPDRILYDSAREIFLEAQKEQRRAAEQNRRVADLLNQLQQELVPEGANGANNSATSAGNANGATSESNAAGANGADRADY